MNTSFKSEEFVFNAFQMRCFEIETYKNIQFKKEKEITFDILGDYDKCWLREEDFGTT